MKAKIIKGQDWYTDKVGEEIVSLEADNSKFPNHHKVVYPYDGIFIHDDDVQEIPFTEEDKTLVYDGLALVGYVGIYGSDIRKSMETKDDRFGFIGLNKEPTSDNSHTLLLNAGDYCILHSTDVKRINLLFAEYWMSILSARHITADKWFKLPIMERILDIQFQTEFIPYRSTRDHQNASMDYLTVLYIYLQQGLNPIYSLT